MNSAFGIAAVVMLIGSVPAAVALCRGPMENSVIGYEFLSSVTVMVLILLPQNFQRPGEFEFPVLLAALLYASGLVYVRGMERWL